jgi:RNA polymerase sigma factor (TIGR02999 family)
MTVPDDPESPPTPTPDASGEVTRVLAAARQGDRDAFDRVYALVYRELRHIAHGQRRLDRPDATLSTTALVHEAYVKLLPHSLPIADRQHFFALAARAMRQILVDAARRRQAAKRGGDAVVLGSDALEVPEAERAAEFVALDDALSRLEALDPRLGKLVELRYFGGLSVEETAETLELSDSTVKRDWRRARAFLQRELERAGFTA